MGAVCKAVGVGGGGEYGFGIVWSDGLNARVKRCVVKWICRGGRTQIRPWGQTLWKPTLWMP